MALTKTVTKLRPTKDHRNIYTIGLNLVLMDDGVEVVNKNVTETVAENAPMATAMTEIEKKAQALIDKYFSEKKKHNLQEYTDGIAGVESKLDLTEKA